MLGAGSSQGGHGKISYKMHDSNKKIGLKSWKSWGRKWGGGIEKENPQILKNDAWF